MISRREEAIASQYTKAKELQEEARAEKERCTEFQAQIEEEKAAAVADAQEKARGEYDRIVTEAREKAEQIVETSKNRRNRRRRGLLERRNKEISFRDYGNGSAVHAVFGRRPCALRSILTKAGEADAK